MDDARRQKHAPVWRADRARAPDLEYGEADCAIRREQARAVGDFARSRSSAARSFTKRNICAMMVLLLGLAWDLSLPLRFEERDEKSRCGNVRDRESGARSAPDIVSQKRVIGIWRAGSFANERQTSLVHHASKICPSFSSQSTIPRRVILATFDGAIIAWYTHRASYPFSGSNCSRIQRERCRVIHTRWRGDGKRATNLRRDRVGRAGAVRNPNRLPGQSSTMPGSDDHVGLS